MRSRFFLNPRWIALVVLLTSALPARGADPSSDANVNANANRDPFADPQFFPIAVWLQSPANAAKYREAGINLYVGLWRGPTDPQLADLKAHGMRVICSQNAVGLAHKDDPTIAGWMHGDEPDNAQPLRGGKGYGPPIPASQIIDDYKRIKANDPSRPILLNLGQGVAWDRWHGRGVRTNHPEDYQDYVLGGDIVSFDIYPGCHTHPDVAGKLWFVAEGVSRLRQWSEDRKSIWNCIECTRVDNPKAKATPKQVKAEVWMSIVRGSRGIIYFSHQFQPKFIEAGLLADPEMLAQVTAVNRRIRESAPILNSPSIPNGVVATSSAADVPVEAVVKRGKDAVYVFAVAMRPGTAASSFRVAVPGFEPKPSAKVEVLDEGREIEFRDGSFRDEFRDWDVHLYRIREQ